MDFKDSTKKTQKFIVIMHKNERMVLAIFTVPTKIKNLMKKACFYKNR